MDLSAISPMLAAAEAARVAEPNELADAADLAAAAAEAPPTATSDTFREIISHYDVEHITPREFSELIQKLHTSGAITEAQFRELSLVRGDLDGARLEADEPLDLVDFYSDRLRNQENDLQRLADRAKKNPQVTADVDAVLAQTRTRLQWLQKFSRVNSSFEPSGIDVLA